MITAKDIELKEFSKAIKGYNIDEVEDFLDLIIVDYEKLQEENKSLKLQLAQAGSAPKEQSAENTSVIGTLEAAKELMNDISASAERRAEVLLKNAELDAQLIQREAKESVVRYTEEGNKLNKQLENFRRRFKEMLEDELLRVDGLASDLVSDFEDTFLPRQEAKEKPKDATVVLDKAEMAKASSEFAWEVSEEKAEAEKAKPAKEAKKEEKTEEKPDLDKTMINIRVDNK
ncbi:MAG: DivIVA domain-containing protein [Clostridia bacterium]|nr:DivIVA domain-containing protein [Clostridia bacterium]